MNEIIEIKKACKNIGDKSPAQLKVILETCEI